MRARFYIRSMCCAALLATLLAMFGPGIVAAPSKTAPAAYERVWPSPPDSPRIAYLKSVAKPSDAGAKISGWSKLGNFITGGDKGNEPLVKPFGVSIDEQDDICVTDTGAPAVCYWKKADSKWHRWTQAGKVAFSCPVAAAKYKSAIYVADTGLNAIVAFTDKGKLLRVTTNHISRPAGIAVSAAGVFVADSAEHRITRFSHDGVFQSSFGKRGSGPGDLNYPTHLHIDRAGRLFVTDSMNHRVQVFETDGRLVTTIGSAGDGPGKFSRPKGVATDIDGNVYIMDGLADRLQLFNLQNQLLLNIGEPGAGPGQFWLANGVAVDSRGAIYVADAYNRRLQILQYLGTR